MKRRVLSMLLAASMTLQLMSGAVFATGTESSESTGATGSTGSAPAVLYGGTCGDDLTWTITSDGVLTISGTGPMYDYDDEERVLAPWSENADQISRVDRIVVKEGVTTLGNYAFSRLIDADSVSLPEGLTSLGDYAFKDCDDLFYVTLPSTVTELGESLFYNCDCLVQVDLSKTSLTELSWRMVLTCGRLQTVKLPDTLEQVSFCAFEHSGLDYIDLPDRVTGLGGYAFSYTDITSLRVPAGVTSIGGDCFRHADCLTAIDLSNTQVYFIGEGAFEYSDVLARAVLPATLTSLGDYAFQGCPALAEVTFAGDVPATLGTDVFAASGSGVEGGLTIYYPAGNETWTEEAMAAFGEGLTFVPYSSGGCGEGLTWTFANGTLTISGEGDMEDYTDDVVPWEEHVYDITRVVVEEGVTSVGEFAFAWLDSLESVSLPEGLTTLDDYALYNSYNLTDLTLPASLERVGLCALAALECLDAFAVAEGSESFAVTDGVLFSADGKTLVQFPAGKLGSGEEPTLLSDEEGEWGGSYEVPAAVTAIGPGAFAGCGGLRTITLPEGLTAIGPYAFMNCGSLYDVSLPDGVTILEEGVFENCGSLDRLTLGSKVETIGPGALRNAWVSALVLPESLKSIESQAFGDFYGSLIFIGSAPAIAEDGFQYASITIYYPGTDASWTEEVRTNYGASEVTWVDAGALKGEADGVTWSLDPVAGVLTLSGEGAMPDYSYDSPAPWAEHTNLIRSAVVEGFTTVGSCAFLDCYSLNEVALPAGLTAIGDYAFQFCRNLERIQLPDSLTTLGAGAFSDCGLTEITLPQNLESVGADAFGWCYDITRVEIPASVTTIGGGAFRYCGLEEIVFLGDAPDIGAEAFAGAAGLAYYPGENATWTDAVRQSYGGALTWAVSGQPLGGACGESVSWMLNLDTGVLTISGTGAMYDWTEENGAPWAGCANQITSVTVGEGVTSVGDWAFCYHDKLEQVSLPASVTCVGERAFYGCERLAAVELPAGLVDLGVRAFAYCESLTEITLPSGITRLSDGLFDDCNNLEEVTLLGEVTAIGDEVFWCCEALDLEIPSTVTELGSYAFASAGLSRAVIPAGVTELADNLFRNCWNLKEVVLHDDVTAIGDGVFYSCPGLEQVDLPEGLLTIGYEAFSYSGLTELNLPAAVTELDDYAFAWSGLTEVTFLGDAPSIGSNAFRNVTATVHYGGDRSGWTSSVRTNYGGNLTWKAVFPTSGTCGEGVTWTYDAQTGVLTISGTGAMEDYTSIEDTPWGCYVDDFGNSMAAVVVEEGVTHVGNYAFSECEMLTEVSLPDGLLSIGERAFLWTSITDITLPETVTEVGSHAFYQCDELAGVELSAQLTAIGDYAFYYCSALEQVDIPAGVTRIGRWAFGFTGLTEVELPAGLAELGKDAFAYTDLTEVTIPKNCAGMDVDAFWMCKQLKAYHVEEGNPSYSSLDGILYNMDQTILLRYPMARAAEEFTLPVGVKRIEDHAFYQCAGLKTVTFNEELAAIGNAAFFECTGLERIDLSATALTAMEDNVFSGCKGLAGVDLSGTRITQVPQRGFSGCDQLRSVHLPATLTRLDYYAFTGCVGLEAMIFDGNAPSVYSDALPSSGTAFRVYYPAGNTTWGSTWRGRDTSPYVTYGGRTYLLGGEMTYGDAAQLAADMNGHLAVLTDTQEVRKVVELLEQNNASGKLWLGGTKEEDWVWTTGEGWLYDNWAQDEPGEGIHLAMDQAGGWYALADRDLAFVVELLGDGAATLTDGTITINESGMITGVVASPTQITIPAQIGGVDVAGLYPGVLSACESLASVTVAEGHTSFRAQDGLLYSADGAALLFCPPAYEGEVEVAATVTAVAQSAFDGCAAISAVTLPQGLKKIESGAFANCAALEGIWFTGDAPAVAADMLEGTQAVLYYPEGRYGWTTPTWNGFAAEPYELDTSVAYFLVEGGSVGYDKTTGQIVGYSAAPTLVYIPAQVDGVAITGIAAKAFANCTSLRDLYVPMSVTSIADDALSGCTGLTLYGGAGSTAQTWAGTAGVSFVPCSVKDVSPATQSSVGGDSLTITLRLTSSRPDVPVTLACADSAGTDCAVDYTVSKKIASGYRVYTFGVDLTALETGAYTFTLGSGDYGAQTQVVYDVDRTPPGAVTGLTVTPGALVNVVAWNQAAEANVASYRLYRALPPDGEFRLLATLADRDTCYYNDKDVEAGTEYFYQLTAVDIYGQVSPPCAPAGGTPHADDEAPRITGITPANGSTLHGTVQVTVTAQDNIQVDSITMETSPDGEVWTVLETVHTTGSAAFTLDTTQWTDTLFVRVSAADPSGNVGVSAAEYQYAVDNTPPAQVTGLWGESSSTIITLHWSDVPDQDFSHFLVEEKQADGSFAFLRKVTGALGVNLTGMAPNAGHTYRVRAVDQVGNQGQPSEEVTVATQADTIAPVIASISPASGRVTGKLSLSFGVSDDYGVASLLVQTSRNGTDWTDAGTVSVDRVSTYQYVGYSLDTAALDEGLLYVRAVATDLAGNVGDSSGDAPFHQYYIDRTAPAAPTGVTAVPEDGAITVKWEQGSEEDLYTYSVYRAVAEDGPYTRVSYNLRQLYWKDSSVSYGTTYYYRVAVQDRVGNLSGQSAAVSAQPQADTTVPTVVSVSPSDGYTLGAATPIRARVNDNNQVTRLWYRVSLDGENWAEALSLTVNSSDQTLTLPVNQAALGGESVWLEVWCEDATGNQSAVTSRHYTLDLTPPAVPTLTVEAENLQVKVTWAGGTEADLAGYKLYRAAGEGSNYSYLLQRSGGSASYTYVDTNVDLGVAYSYYLVALDRTGNAASGEKTPFLVPVDRDTVAPRAVVEGSRVGTTGVELSFRGDGSTDNVAVVSYRWDFGDGSTSSLRAPAHAYAKAGSYTVTLTVYDAAGNSSQDTLEVTVKDPVSMGTITVTVTDENGSPLSNAGVYLDLGSEEQGIVYTNVRGVATLTAAQGEHVVGVYTTGYLPAKETVEVIANAKTELAISVVEKDLVVGELTVRRMTLEEIKAAGINVYDPANQEVFEFEVHLTYGTYEAVLKSTYNSQGQPLTDPQQVTVRDSGGEPRNLVIGFLPSRSWDVGGSAFNPQTEPPMVVVLDIPGRVSWLKDFFEVRLTVINQADEEFVLDNCSANLNVPSGLTLMDTNYTDASSSCYMGSIPGQSSKSAYWVIRGDKAGQYDLTASFSGILRDFEETITATFATEEPFTVRQNQGLSLEVVAEDAIVADTDGAIRVGLRNEDRDPYYMPSVELDENLVELVSTYKTNGRVKVNTDREILYPGETLWADYIVLRENWESLTYWEGEDFYLMEQFMQAVGGTTTLPFNVEIVPPFTIAADLITVSRIHENGSESEITYIDAGKDNFYSAQVPDLMVRTYRLDEDGNYQPCSMDVKVQDSYQETETTYTTSASGELRLEGYEIKTLSNSKTYSIRITSSRAKPVELPLVVRGESALTGVLTVYAYTENAETGEILPLEGAVVTLPGVENMAETTGEKGKVTFKGVPHGPQEVVVTKEGYLAVNATVEMKDETEVSYCLTADLDPSASRILTIENTLTGQQTGNRTVIPKGHITGTMDFALKHRIAEGESFGCYHYRIVRDDRVAETGTFRGANEFRIDLAELETGERLQFAVETTGAEGQALISPFMDSGIVVTKAPGFFEDLGFTLAQVKAKVETDVDGTFPLDPDTFIRSFTSSNLFAHVLVEDDEDGYKAGLLSELNSYSLSSSKERWKFPVRAKYDPSGKLIFSIVVGREQEGSKYTNSRYTTAGAYSTATSQGVGFLKVETERNTEFELSGALTLDVVFQFDPVAASWSWSVLGGFEGGQKFTLLKGPGAVFYGEVTLELEEAGKWSLYESNVGPAGRGEFFANGAKPKELTAAGDLKGSAGAKVVIDKLASAGVYLRGGLEVNFISGTIRTRAAFGAEANILCLKGSQDILGGQWEVYNEPGSSSQSFMTLLSEGEEELVLASKPAGAAWLGETSGRVFTGAFGDSQPRMTALPDGSLLLVWSDYTGDDTQPLALRWSRFDGENWSEPAWVDENGTADLYPCLVSTETGAALVWVDMTQAIPEDVDSLTAKEIEETLVPLLSVSLATFDSDTGAWSERVTLTESAGLAARPVVTADAQGDLLAAWIANDADTLSPDGEHPDCVRWVLVSGGAVTERGSMAAPDAAIHQVAAGWGETGFRLAFQADNGAGLEKLYHSTRFSGGWTEPELVNTINAPDETFAYGSGGELYYINSGCLYACSGSANRMILRSELLGDDTSGLTLASGGEGDTLVWVCTLESDAALCMVRVDEDGKAGEPVQLQRAEDGLLSEPSLCQAESGAYLLYQHSTMGEENWQHDAAFRPVQSQADLALEEADVTHSNYLVPGLSLTTYIQAANLGLGDPGGVTAVISTDRAGEDVVTSLTKEGGLILTLDWTVPADYNGQSLYLTVLPLEGTDSHRSNNTLELGNVIRDVSVSGAAYVGRLEGKDVFTVTVSNEGLAQCGQVELTVEDLAGETVLLAQEVTIPAPGASATVRLEVDALDRDANQSLAFALPALAGEMDVADNRDFLALNARAEESADLVITQSLWLDGRGQAAETIPEGEVTFRCALDNLGAEEDTTAVVAAYDGSGKLLSTALGTVRVDREGQGELTCTLDLAGLTPTALKAFLLDGRCVPIGSAALLETE